MFSKQTHTYSHLNESFYNSKFDNGLQSVVVVIRNIDNISSSKSNYGDRYILDKDCNVIPIVHNQLNRNDDISVNQAIAIANNLPLYIINRNLIHKNKWAPIGIIHTQNPVKGYNGWLVSSPNPFETVYPLIRGLVSRVLYDNFST